MTHHIIKFIMFLNHHCLTSDLLGSSAFAVVQNDMNGNIKKIRTKQLDNPVKFATLQDIVLSEASEKKKDATQGLLWLTR